jgi:hypothetical protein
MRTAALSDLRFFLDRGLGAHIVHGSRRCLEVPQDARSATFEHRCDRPLAANLVFRLQRGEEFVGRVHALLELGIAALQLGVAVVLVSPGLLGRRELPLMEFSSRCAPSNRDCWVDSVSLVRLWSIRSVA